MWLLPQLKKKGFNPQILTSHSSKVIFKIYPVLLNTEQIKTECCLHFFFFFLIPVFAITGGGWSLTLLDRDSLQSLPAWCHVVERVSKWWWISSHIQKARIYDPFFFLWIISLTVQQRKLATTLYLFAFFPLLK